MESSHVHVDSVSSGSPRRAGVWLPSLWGNGPLQFQVHLALSMTGFQSEQITVPRTKNFTI